MLEEKEKNNGLRLLNITQVYYRTKQRLSPKSQPHRVFSYNNIMSALKLWATPK